MIHRMQSRREFVNMTAAGAALAQAPTKAAKLPTVRFGKADVTRLIIGSNPFYGYSHFNNIYNQVMAEWMTQDRRIEVLKRCEAGGIGTWQVHYEPRTMEDVKRYRAEGGAMNWFLLGHGLMMENPKLAYEAAKLGPIGIAHHGNVTDERFRSGKMDQVQDFCKLVRQTGVMVGVSTHNPAVVDYIESKGWDVDYFQCCLYRVTRTAEEAAQVLNGESPIGEIYLKKDPERMCRMIRQTKRPVLAFKLFGAGRTANNRQQVQASFRFALENIKPGDACIVGMWPKYKDEVSENIAIVRELTRGGAPA
jgi:hypothetical protein